tara:strand:+ start:180 stop:1877 length:1698 start_codon:yes stop_codon:yes gene_type:complete
MADQAPMSESERLRFATAVLGALEAPLTEGNMMLLLAWMYRENTGAKNNPFATTFALDDSTEYNNANPPVRNFRTFEEGVEATVRTFDPDGVSRTDPNRYNDILAALQEGTSPEEVLESDVLKDELFTWGTFRGEDDKMSAGWAGASMPELRRSWENFRRTQKDDLQSLYEEALVNRESWAAPEETDLLPVDGYSPPPLPLPEDRPVVEELGSLDDAIDEAEREALGETPFAGLGEVPGGKTPKELVTMAGLFGGSEYFLNHPDFVIERDGQMVNALWYAFSVEKIRDPDRIKDLFQETKWWRTRNSIQRSFDVGFAEAGGPDWGHGDVAFDPQNLTLDQLEILDAQLDAISLEAGQLGIDVVANRDALLRMAYKASRMGMTQAEWKQEFSNTAGLLLDVSKLGGAVATERKFVDTLSRTWMIPMSDEVKDQNVLDLYYGKTSQATLTQIFKEQAKNKFPTLAGVIDLGYSPASYMQSYQTKASTLLERPVDLMGRDSNMFTRIISGGKLDNGTNTIMSQWEADNYVRGLEEWNYTRNAEDDAYAFATDVAQLFGGLGTPSYFRV